MLALTRKAGEEVIINGNIVVKVSKISASKVRLAFDAPREMPIIRKEIIEKESKYDRRRI